MNPNEVKKSDKYKELMSSKAGRRKISTATVQSKESCEPGDKNCGVKIGSKKVEDFGKAKKGYTKTVKIDKPIYETEEVYKPKEKEPKVKHTYSEGDKETVISERVPESEYNRNVGNPIGRPVNSEFPREKEMVKVGEKKVRVGWESKKYNYKKDKKSLVEKNSEKLQSRLKK